MKPSNVRLGTEYLAGRAAACVASGWPVPKWITFAQGLIEAGYKVRLHEAQRTVSKYLTVSKKGSHRPPVRIRFSNHEPIPAREARGDCDFFVGKVNHGPWQTTEQARAFVEAHFAARPTTEEAVCGTTPMS